jgi:hypothetical protein
MQTFREHYANYKEPTVVSENSTFLQGEITAYVELEGMIPNSFMVSSHLLLSQNPRVTEAFRQMTPAQQMSLINTTIDQLTVARGDSEPWHGAKMRPSLHRLVEFVAKLSIVSFFDNSASLVDTLPQEATLDSFVAHTGFASPSQKLTYPIDTWLIEKVEAAFSNVQDARAQLFRSALC